MEQEQKNDWWKVGLEIFSKVSSWVIVPLLLALGIGKYLDGIYGTRPWIFLGSAILGFSVSCYGIVRTMKDYLKTLKETDEHGGNKSH